MKKLHIMLKVSSFSRFFERRVGYSSLPIDLVIVRNGLCQGTVALHHRKETQPRGTAKLPPVHASKWRLTSLGKSQAKSVGDWIKTVFKKPFDAYLTGEYVRSLETAYCLGLPDARWIPSLYLRPRDFGVFSDFGRQFNESEFRQCMAERARDSFYWTPPNGESIAHLTLRTARIIHWIRSHVPSDGAAIIVTHKDVMETLRIRIERISQMAYPEQIASPPSHIALHHCSVLQYTRRNPETGEVAPRYRWMRVSTPWLGKKYLPDQWEEVYPRMWTNDDIMAEVSSVQTML